MLVAAAPARRPHPLPSALCDHPPRDSAAGFDRDGHVWRACHGRPELVRVVIAGHRVVDKAAPRVVCSALPAHVPRVPARIGCVRSLTEPVLAREKAPPTPTTTTIPTPTIPPRPRTTSASAPTTPAPTMSTATATAPAPAAPAARERVAGVDTRPSSPPELSSSKSSRSSDSDSSSRSDDASSTSDKLADFVRLTLQDGGAVPDGVDCNMKPEDRPTLTRPPKRLSGGSEARPPRPPPSPRNGTTPDHGRPGAKRAAAAGTTPSLDLRPGGGGGGGLRRGVTSPSSPSFLTLGRLRGSSSRSPSPSRPILPAGSSPQALSATSPRSSWGALPPATPTGGFVRRQSWQLGSRKTAQQLEAEVDEDGDEEVPDEAILENVPITPYLGGPSRSPSASPHRRPSHHALSASHSGLHSANVPKNAKRPSAPPPLMPSGRYGAPRSPRHGRPPMFPHSATSPSFPSEPLRRKHRSKSWTEDLNDEARHLSAALEEYAGQLSSSDKRRSGTYSAGSSPPRPAGGLYMKRAKTSIVELPQAQNGNVMIDPLPISKEKEAVLTRTRPSWLPPKSQKEERRHLKEWEQMMARAAEAEKKKALKLKELAENKQELRSSIARIWDEHVLPNWDAVIREPRTRELWWRGVTPKDRGVVWQKAVGNELGLSPASFDAARRRAAEVEEQIAELPAEERHRNKEAAWFDAIERDVPHVYPELDVFHRQSPVGRALSDVLKAYAMYRSDVGYVYGTHLVAGVLCLHMRAPEAFVTLANVLNRPTPLAFLVHDQPAMARAYELVLGTLKYKFTKLHSHLTSAATGLKPDEFLDPVFRCLFAYNLPPEHVSRLWDIFLFEGDKALIRAAVAVLGCLESKLYGSRDEILALIGWCNEKKWDLGSEEDFIRAVRDAGKVDAKGEVHSA